MSEYEKILNLQSEQKKINKEYDEKISDLKQSYKKSNRFVIEHHTYDFDDCKTYPITITLKERFPNVESVLKYLETIGYYYTDKGEYRKSNYHNYDDYMIIKVD